MQGNSNGLKSIAEIGGKLGLGEDTLVPITGDIMTMPGLPKRPNAEGMDVDSAGRITGLF